MIGVSGGFEVGALMYTRHRTGGFPRTRLLRDA